MGKRLLILALLVLVVSIGITQPVRADASGWIAFTGPDGNVYLIRPDGSGRAPITQDGRMHPNAENEPEGRVNYFNLRWSPDGRWLALVRQFSHVSTAVLNTKNSLYLYDSQANQLHMLGNEITDFDWSPDSQSLIYSLPGDYITPQGPVKPARGIWQYQLSTGQAAELVQPQHAYSLTAPHFSPGGRYLTFYEVVFMEGIGNFGYYDLKADRQFVWDAKDQPVGGHGWTTNDSLMIFDRNTYVPQPGERIYKSDMDFKYIVPISPEDTKTAFYGPQVSPDGKQVAFFASPENAPYASIWVMNIDGSSARHLYSPNENLYLMSWSPDSQKIVFIVGPYQQEQIMLLDAATGKATSLATGSWFSYQPGSTASAVPSAQPPASSDDPVLQVTPSHSGQDITAAHPTEEGLNEQPISATFIPAKANFPDPAPSQPAPPRFTYTLIFVMFGLAALIVIVIVVMLLKRKQ